VATLATLAAVAVAGAGALAAATPSPAAAAAPVTLPLGDGTRPESITRGWDGKFFVSLQNKPDLGLKDGEIRILDPQTGAVTPFVPPGTLDNPRGLAFTGRFLVVTDTTVVWKIDRAGKATLLADASAFPHPIAFFNDAAPETGGRAVFVSEMGHRELMRNPATGLLWPTESPQALAIPAASRIYRIALNGKVTEA